MTVGECGNLSSDGALDYISQGHNEIDMLFHFEIGKNPKIITVNEYKETEQRWIDLMKNNAWITQFLTNHDTPRQVSRFGNDQEYRVPSAKLLATLTHTMPGTPFVYQGEEIGMTDVYFETIDDYDERYTVGKYWTMVEAGEDPKVALDKLRAMSRDNARTPYQWDDSTNAGFTTGKPWIKVNPRYTEINYAADRASSESIFEYYKKLLNLRKTHPAIIDGEFQFLLMDHPQIVMYLRKCARETMLVVCNFSNETVNVEIPQELNGYKWERILTNHADTQPSLEGRTQWKPWEAEIYTVVL